MIMLRSPWLRDICVLFAVAVVTASEAYGQGQSRTIPETLSILPVGPDVSIGTPPGTLAPSEFSASEASIIGGRKRSGAGRVPRKKQAAVIGTTRGMNPLDLPTALPATTHLSVAESVLSLPLASIVDDDGPPDGLTLDQAIKRLMAVNLDILALKYEIDQAQADVITAGLRANPLLYGDTQFIPYGSYNALRPVGPTEYDINITHPLDVSNKRKNRVEVARAAKSTVEAQFQDAVRRQIGILYRAFVELQSARLNFLTSEAAVRDHQLLLVAMRKSGQDEEEIDKIEEQLDLAGDGFDDATDTLEDAREVLAVMLNLNPRERETLQPRGSLRDTAPPPPALDELTRIALTHRPDLMAAKRGITRANSEVGLARASKYDDWFLFYDPLSYQDNRASKLPSGRSWSIGLTVPLPIYNRNQGNIARATSNAVQTAVEASSVERKIISEVRLAEREFRNSKSSLEKIERVSRPKARASRVQAAKELANDEIDITEYMEIIDKDNDVAKSYRDVLIRHRKSMLDLNTAVGVRLFP